MTLRKAADSYRPLPLGDGGVDIAVANSNSTGAEARAPWCRHLITGVAGGLILTLAFDPWSVSITAPAALAVLVIAVASSPTSSRAALVGYAFGLIFLLGHLWWLKESIGTVAWLLVALAESAWWALFGAVAHKLDTRRFAIITIPAAWTSIEALRIRWPFGGFPWGQLGFSAVDGLWATTLPFVGVVGGGFLIALTGTALARLMRSSNAPSDARTNTSIVLITLFPVALSSVQPYTVTASGTARVGIVQGEVPGDGTDVSANREQVTGTLVSTTLELAEGVRTGVVPPLDLLVWPESSTSVGPGRDPTLYDRITDAVQQVNAPMLIGAIANGPTPATVLNQGQLWGSSGPSGQAYTKQHPVPFGEYIPLRPVLESLSDRFEEIPRDMVPGSARRPLTIQVPGATISLAAAICFDVAFGDVIAEQVLRGANLVAVQTSNAMFTGTAQRQQQFTITRARAMEAGRTVVVASLNGISGFIAPDGSVVQRSVGPGAQSLVRQVALSDELTPAVQMSGLLAPAAWSVAILALLLPQRRRAHPRDSDR